MPKYFTLFLLIFTLTNCNNNRSKKTEIVKEEIDVSARNAEWELDGKETKIALIAIMRNIEYDTVHSILYDYFYATDKDENKPIKEIITILSKKYKYPGKGIASLIFGFIYNNNEQEIIDDAPYFTDTYEYYDQY
ncbi:MAG: hypothetical protein H6549_12825 [Chitinophagales bacterium]|nr:hypothetical protein [Chitinophagales bacterium]